MNKQKGLAPLLIIILIALVVGGYLVYKNYSQYRIKVPSSAPPASTTPASPISTGTGETANWKMYKTESFSFQYPQNWQITNCLGFEGILLDNKPRSCATEPSTFKVVMIKNERQDTSFSEEKMQGILLNEREVTIDGKTFLQAELDYGKDNNEGTPLIKYITTKIKVKNQSYRFDLYDLQMKQIYDQILSTFKFIP